ncbi:MAG: hypothetical protein CL916_12510, partial [Deltaproteobacteria bacterium]|nr:hypothetical protein [Deltaproteobacteria bacterium]
MSIFRYTTRIHTHRLLSHRDDTNNSSLYTYRLKHVAYHYACIPDSDGLWALMQDKDYFKEQYQQKGEKSASYETLKIGIAHQIQDIGHESDVRLASLVIKAGRFGLDTIQDAHIAIRMFQKDPDVLDDVFLRISVLREEGILLACMMLLQVEAQRESSSIHSAERILLFLEDTIPENLIFWDEFVPSSFAATWIQEICFCWPELNLAPIYNRCNDIRAIVYEVCNQETTKDPLLLQNLLTFSDFISEPVPKGHAMWAIARQQRLIQSQDAAIKTLLRIEEISKQNQRIEDVLVKVTEEYILHHDFENGLRLIDSFSEIANQASLLITLEKQMRAMKLYEDAKQIRDRAYAYAKEVIYPWKQYAMFLDLVPAFKEEQEIVKELKNSAIHAIQGNRNPRYWVSMTVGLARFQTETGEMERAEQSMSQSRRLVSRLSSESDRAD